MRLSFVFPFIFGLLTCINVQLCAGVVIVKFLEEGSVVKGNEKKYNNQFEIYCYKGRLKHIVHIWETVQMQLSLHPDEFTLFEGYNAEEVSSKYEHQLKTWHFNFFNKRQLIRLNPFNQTCVGVISNRDFEIKLTRLRVDYWRVLLCLSGFALFLSAPTLSSNSLFYYLTGVSLGVFGSLIIFVYILSRMMPRKSIMYSILAGGWTIGVYVVQLLWDNVRVIAMEYKSFVLYYIFCTGLISFIVCYRYGPVSDPKSVNLIRWALRGSGLVMIFLSSDFQEASMSLNFMLLIYNYLPIKKLGYLIQKIKKRWLPPKQRLLTDDEYHQQGVIETEKALDSLRGYCSSPECNQWKTVLRLKDPLRFAKFMEGSSHLQDNEVLAFETDTKSISYAEYTDDDTTSSDE